MFYEHLIERSKLKYNFRLEQFAEIVRRYDTWEWKTKYDDQHAKKVNDLLHIIGRQRFFDRFIEDLFPSFSEGEWMLLELEEEKIKGYIKSKQRQIIEKEIAGKNVGVVFAERYSTQLGNELAEDNPHLDVIAIINPSYSVSYRTVKTDVHLGEFAKQFGGGGHPQAAGSPINEQIKQRIVNHIFDLSKAIDPTESA